MTAKLLVRTKGSERPRARKASQEAWILRDAGKLQIIQASALAGQDWLLHGFSTRGGGASKLESRREGRAVRERVLNLGLTDWDARECVERNRAAFMEALGAGRMEMVPLRQIHSDLIQVAGNEEPGGTDDSHALQPSACQGDALISQTPGLLLAVQTADCIPILLADPARRAVAAIHAGWRGTLRRIAAKTVGRMQMQFGTRPRDIIAAVGPGIGRCCYEVGAEVVKEFGSQFPRAHEWFDGPWEALDSGEEPTPLPWLTMRPPGHAEPPPRARLDLHAANRAILVDAGVPAENIFASALCTSCRGDLLFSYRREAPTGRMMAVIGVR